MTARLAKIVFRVILKSTFLSTSHIKCGVWCNSFLSFKRQETLLWARSLRSYLIVHAGLQGELRNGAWDVTSGLMMTDNHKHCEQRLKEGAVFISLCLWCKIFIIYFSNLNHTACKAILLPLDLVFAELLTSYLVLKVGKLRLRQAVCDQVKSEFTK